MLNRSRLFAVVTAEEKGLLRSRYATKHPTIPWSRPFAERPEHPHWKPGSSFAT